jgi:predicted lactoylglutathione lyase
MFAFITIGTNNLKKSSQFYDELLKTLGIVRVIQDERYVGYSKEDNLEIIELYIMCPFDKKKATIGNGTMISFDGKNPEKVNEFHQKALKIGATNEGFPGPRHGEDYYAYIRDLDGNKICVFAAT